MKFLIVAFHPRSMTPYAKQYEDEIIKAGYAYDIFFWDRFSNAPLEKKNNEYIFHRVCTLGGNRLKKIYPFYLFRKTLQKIIKANRYDKIIILNTMPGVLLNDVIVRSYQNRYIFDIRDYTYEKFTIYLNIVHKLINNSYFTAISSRGFKSFLGENTKLVVNHNISNLNNMVKEPSLSKSKKKIVLGFVGAIRYFNENIALIKSLKDSNKFIELFVGRELVDCPLQEYCSNMNYRNVTFKGAFQNEQKPQIYQDIDIINSLYGNDSLEVRTLLPNRLYDALIFKKPILTTKGTYLAKVVEQWGIGFTLDASQNYSPKKYQQQINDYVNNFNKVKFIKNANDLLHVVKSEQQYYHDRISDFVRE